MVVCPSIGHLTACVLAVSVLLRPLEWQSVMLPVLPSEMVAFLEAPVPFVVGVSDDDVREWTSARTSEAFRDAIKMKSGKTYSPSLVENEIARLERLAIQQGLNFVRVDPRISRNDRDLTLDVNFVLTRGPRIFVERIDIEGNTTTNWKQALEQLALAYPDRITPYL